MRSCGLRGSGEGLLLRRSRWLRKTLPPGSTAPTDYLMTDADFGRQMGESTGRASSAAGCEFVVGVVW